MRNRVRKNEQPARTDYACARHALFRRIRASGLAPCRANQAAQWNWHFDVLCEYLEALAADSDMTRLIINMPPRFGKSLRVGLVAGLGMGQSALAALGLRILQFRT